MGPNTNQTQESVMERARTVVRSLFSILIGLLALAASNLVFAQLGVWETRAAMPTVRGHAASGAINGKLYVAGGSNGTSLLATLEVYDPVTNLWTTKASMPAARAAAAGAVIDGKLYVVGGVVNLSGQKVATLEAYDPLTDTWASRASMANVRSFPGAVAIAGKLYVVGGCTAGCAPVTGALEVYDPVANAWTTKASIPTARGMPDVVALNDLFYVMGGCCGTTGAETTLMQKTVEVYNPTTNTWTSKAQHVVGAADTTGAIDGKIYVVKNGATEVYNPATDAWAALSTMPTARDYATGGVIGQKLYVVGGSPATAVVEALGQVALTASATPTSIAYGGSSTLTSSGGTGNGAVSYAISSGSDFCSLATDTLTGTGIGTCTVTASKAADGNHGASTASVDVTVVQADQTITFGALANKTLGEADFTVSATAASGLSVTFASQTAGVCAVSGTTVSLITAGTCTIRATQAGNANYNAAAHVDQGFTVLLPAGSSASLTGATGAGTATAVAGGVGWVFAPGGTGLQQSAGFIPLQGHPKSPPALPPNQQFSYDLLDFVAINGVPGSVLTVTITYPGLLPRGTQYWKYGRTAAEPTPHWYIFPGALISGNTITLSITDGAAGDDDLSANGTIVEPGGPAAPTPVPIPTLSDWSTLLLAGLLLTFGRGRLQRRSGI